MPMKTRAVVDVFFKPFMRFARSASTNPYRILASMSLRMKLRIKSPEMPGIGFFVSRCIARIVSLMKRNICLLVAGLMVSACGCATNYVVEWKAKSHVEFDNERQQDIHVAGQPAYYALLPVSVPFDIATSPVQLCVLLAWPACKLQATNMVFATNYVGHPSSNEP